MEKRLGKNFIDLMFIVVLAVFLVFMINFVVADTYQFWGQTDTITVNYSVVKIVNEDVLQNFSILINSTTARMAVSFNITGINVTLPEQIIFQNGSNSTGGNISAAQVLFKNTSNGKILSWSNSTAGEQGYIIAGGNASFNNSLIYFNFTAYTPGKYNISVQIIYNASFGTSPLAYNKTNITIWVNDTTKPFNVNVTTQGKINVSRNANNVSGSVEINVSAFDNGNHTYGARGYDVTGVNVTIWNSSDVVNASYMMTNVTGQYWNFTLPTTKFPDGPYNISIIVNDTNGNINRTTNISVNIDNTAPTGSATCTPATVNLGDTVTCSCSVTDATSGENSSVTSITGSPSTTSTGTFTETCSFADLAGNTGTTTAQYTVEQGGSGAGAGGAGAAAETKTHSWTKITPGVVSIMKNFDPEIGVKEIEITVTNEAQNVKITVTKYDDKPANVTVEKTGKVYRYLQVNAKNLEEKLEKAKMTVQVAKNWTTENSVDKENVALFKFDETSSEWNELTTKLTTTYTEEDDNYYYYESELTSFSYFAIGAKAVEEAPEEEITAPEEIIEVIKKNLILWIVIAVGVLAIIIGVIVAKKKKK